MKTLRELKKYTTITTNIGHNEMIDYILANETDVVSIYLPVKEFVLKAILDKEQIQYMYVKELDGTFLLEIYNYNRENYEFVHKCSVEVTSVEPKEMKYTIIESSVEKNKIKKIIKLFEVAWIYIIMIKDSPKIIQKATRTSKKSSSNKSNVIVPKEKTVNYISDKKILYTIVGEDIHIKSFKKRQRHLDSWQVIGHTRKLKNGKTVFVKPYVKGDKEKIKSKEYVIK